MSEAHVPTQHSTSSEEPRVPSSHVDARRSRDSRRPPAKRPHAPKRLNRLRGRHSIEEVRRARRSSSGPVWVRYQSLSTPPEVGYAIGRVVGAAVVRNRLRRRLRAVMAGLAPDLAAGRYLVGAGPDATHLSFAELTEAVRSSLATSGALARD
jgi:ribonuclease P protein component